MDDLRCRAAFIPAWLDDLPLSFAEYRVYCRVCRRGQCSEAIDNIAKSIGGGESTIRRALKSLVDRGLISRQDREGRTSVYTITPYVCDTPVKSDTPTPIRFDTPPLTSVTPKGSPIKDKNTYRGEWLEFRAIYPKRDGGSNLAAAESRFLLAVKAGTPPQEIVAGARAYAASCDRDHKTGTPYVAQATTWINQRRWLEDYAPSSGSADFSGFKTKESWTQQH